MVRHVLKRFIYIDGMHDDGTPKLGCDLSGKVHLDADNTCGFETLCGSKRAGQSREYTFRPITCQPCLDMYQFIQSRKLKE